MVCSFEENVFVKTFNLDKTLNQGELVEQSIFRMDIVSKIPIRVVHVLPNTTCPNHPFKSTHGVVEFYDKRFEHTPDGQFITRYQTSTLYEGNSGSRGLDLNSGVPDWDVDSNAMKRVLNWLHFNDLKNRTIMEENQCQYCGTKKHSKHGICEKCGRF